MLANGTQADVGADDAGVESCSFLATAVRTSVRLCGPPGRIGFSSVHSAPRSWSGADRAARDGQSRDGPGVGAAVHVHHAAETRGAQLRCRKLAARAGLAHDIHRIVRADTRA